MRSVVMNKCMHCPQYEFKHINHNDKFKGNISYISFLVIATEFLNEFEYKNISDK